MNIFSSRVLRYIFILSLIFLPGQSLLAQNGGSANSRIDSLERVTKTLPEDSNKVVVLNLLADEYQKSDGEKAILISWQALVLSESLNFNHGRWKACQNLGIANYNLGNYQKAVEHYSKQLEAVPPTAKELIAGCYHNLGISTTGMGNYLEALDYHLKADSIYRELKDTAGITGALQNIGVVYFSRKTYDMALKYYMEALSLVKNTRYHDNMQDTYNNIGTVYLELGDLELALEYFSTAIKMYESRGDEWGSAYPLQGQGEAYVKMKDYANAVEYLSRAIEISEKYGDKFLVIYCYNMIGHAYAGLGSFEIGLAFQKKALDISNELQLPDEKQLVNKSMGELYERIGNTALALQHHKLSSSLRDSLLNAENSRQVNELASKYDTDKKERAIEMLSKDNDLRKLAMNRQKIITWSVLGGLGLVIALAVIIFVSYKQKKKAHADLELINGEVVEKNRKITESINYASRIQKAILPPDGFIQRFFPESFVLFKPKDIVSGDFYWSARKGALGMLAAVDCTGHGVPGAFMSMIGNRLLSEIVNERGITNPAEVLKKLHAGVVAALHQEDESGYTRDGMDIAFCRLDMKKMELQYAGAHNSLYLIRDGKLSETKGDNLFIGDDRFGDDYTNHVLQLEKGDRLYIFSDGFADQFGGEKRQKFFYSRFQDLLVEVHKNPAEDQHEHLNTVFENWVGEGEQIDDVLVIGMSV